MSSNDVADIEPILGSASDVVLDGGLLLEYFSCTTTRLQTWLNDHLFNDAMSIRLHAHEIARAEVYYITCRLEGTDKAKQVVDQLKDYILFHGEFVLTEIAGQIKCAHSIALADCYSIATGRLLDCPILFKEEVELDEAVITSIKMRFGTSIIMLQST